MRIVLVAGVLVALAGLALGTSLKPAGHVERVTVSVGAPGVPVTVVQAPGSKAPGSAVPAKSIARSADQVAETVAPVIPAPPPAPSDLGPQVQEPHTPIRCHGELKKICPPLPQH